MSLVQHTRRQYSTCSSWWLCRSNSQHSRIRELRLTHDPAMRTYNLHAICLCCGSFSAIAAPVLSAISQSRLPISTPRRMVEALNDSGAWRRGWLPDLGEELRRRKAGGSSLWTTYVGKKTLLERHPDDAELKLATAEALLKWMRQVTNGNFPTAETGRVGVGDSPASRKVWKKYAPEALRLLQSASSYVESGAYDVAKYRFLHAEASTYLSSAKGVIRAAIQGDAISFMRNVKPLVADHPTYQGGVGHTFMGAFYLAAPWPVQDLDKAQTHFDAAMKIDPRSRRNHYCQGLMGLATGDQTKAEASFRQAVKCKPQSFEEKDVGDFFLKQSEAALRALSKN